MIRKSASLFSSEIVHCFSVFFHIEFFFKILKYKVHSNPHQYFHHCKSLTVFCALRKKNSANYFIIILPKKTLRQFSATFCKEFQFSANFFLYFLNFLLQIKCQVQLTKRNPNNKIQLMPLFPLMRNSQYQYH